MIEVISVLYNETTDSDCVSREFSLTEKRAASAFARSTSKKSGQDSFMYKSKGFYNNGIFNLVESSWLAGYRNGKKLK